MIAYTITAPLVDGTSYVRTESGSGSSSFTRDTYFENYGDPDQSRSGRNINGRTIVVNANGGGGETRSDSGNGAAGFTYPNEGQNQGPSQKNNNSGSYSEFGTTDPSGAYTNSHIGASGETEVGDKNYANPDGGNTRSNNRIGGEQGHIMAGRTAPPLDSNGENVGGAEGPVYSRENGFTDVFIQGDASAPNIASDYGSVSEARYFNTLALQTTTKTTVTNYGKITTTTQEKLAKVGTTITQIVGTLVVTLPTTTNGKSWTENTTTNTTATEDATVVTTSMGIDSFWKKTAHTVCILGKGETTAFLKSDVALNATNGGPTDTAAYDTYNGPTTFTITRAAGTTSQKPVVADTATDADYILGEWLETTDTLRRIVAANSSATYYTGWGPPYRFNLPLFSTSKIIQTGVSESSTELPGWRQEGSWGANAKTTTRSAWGQTSVTYNLAGVSYTEGVPTYTQETYAQPIVRSGSGSYQNDGPTLDEDGNEVEGITEANGGANAFGEQANYFVNFQNQSSQKKSGGADAFYGLAYAWGTLGGTTAEPYQSISVDGIASSESVTWPFVSISAGVQTPMPTVTVSQKPATSEASSTAATKTEATTRRIWGNEFGKSTSSQNSSTGTSGSTTTPIQAGGGAITSFQLGGARGFPINQLAGGWIPVPDMFVVGGIAQTNDSTAIIPPGEYANSTITAPQSFSGSSIANTYFEKKSGATYLCYPS